jgi:hypothetical protein
MHVLKDLGGKTKAVTSFQLTEIIYKDYPKDLWPSAENTVIQHLKKLHKEGKVEEIEDGFSCVLKNKH